ncbi:PIR Superfamily Protein [Plasmodium ovale wallikeri]|uniref:PIR Superfamily Protein n=2 Tax=Plasmodium ovale TaxID=36330 RepID=A0A1A9AGE1_PLAOA
MNPKEREEYYNVVHEFVQYKIPPHIYENYESGRFQYSCDRTIKDSSENKEKINDSCIHFLKYLKYLKENISLHQKTGYCKFLNYTLNINLQNYLKNTQRTLNFYKMLNTEYPSQDYYIEVCENEIRYIEKFVLGNIETLYNLYDNFGKYKSGSTSGNLSQCYYANACASIYNNCIKTCEVKYDELFCAKLKAFKEEYNAELTPGKSCYNEKNVLSYPENNSTLDTVHSSWRHESHVLVGGSKFNSLGNNMITPIVTLLIIPITLFMLYKYTPFGSWLRPKIKRMNKTWNNINEENDELLIDNSQIYQINSQGKNYHITYNSTQN